MRDRDQHASTVEDLLARPEDARLELIDGTIVEKAAPSAEHALAQGALVGALFPAFHRRSGAGGPGGWWILAEVDVELGPHEVFRPDLAGWRRARVAERPSGRPVRIVPDWVCEVLSPSNRRRDTVEKLRRYHQAGVGHYWMIDPDDESLTVLRHEPDGYKVALVATREETVRAEPFGAIELRVGVLFGDEPDDVPSPP